MFEPGSSSGNPRVTNAWSGSCTLGSKCHSENIHETSTTSLFSPSGQVRIKAQSLNRQLEVRRWIVIYCSPPSTIPTRYACRRMLLTLLAQVTTSNRAKRVSRIQVAQAPISRTEWTWHASNAHVPVHVPNPAAFRLGLGYNGSGACYSEGQPQEAPTCAYHVQIFVHTYIYIYMQTRRFIYGVVYTHTYMHTYIHTCIRKYIYIEREIAQNQPIRCILKDGSTEVSEPLHLPLEIYQPHPRA